jgi:hypothetical protein
MKSPDISGQRFGRWLVLERGPAVSDGRPRWKCMCDCGMQKLVLAYHLRAGTSQSCGCYKRERATRHGLRNHRLYRIWRLMWGRCTDESLDSYKYYGARGVRVCQRWENVELFYADVLESYETHAAQHGQDNTSLDRIDVNGNYEPPNVRWSTCSEQAQNRRIPKNNTSGVMGVYKSGRGNWCATITTRGKCKYLGAFDTLEEAQKARRDAEQDYWRMGGER